jgi:hypothetical protein
VPEFWRRRSLLKPAEANTYAKFVLDMGAATQQMKGNTMEDYKNYYNKKNVQPLRPYVPGEDMSGIYVNPVDTVEEGGMIAHLPNNPVAKWYITSFDEFFEANYVEAEQAARGNDGIQRLWRLRLQERQASGGPQRRHD